jgi:hypothetical protein
MLPKQLNKKPTKILSVEDKTNRRVFWQGYLFPIGVGGLIVCTLNYFKKYIYDNTNVVLTSCLIIFIVLGVYGAIVGYFAGSIWSVRDRLLNQMKNSMFWCSASISTPLTLYLCALVIKELHINFIINFMPMLICAFIHWLCLTFFIVAGMHLGTKHVKP